MDYNEMYRKVLEIFPDAQMEEDMDGQLVIYTDMKVAQDDKVVPFPKED
jgi:hypothetical protein